MGGGKPFRVCSTLRAPIQRPLYRHRRPHFRRRRHTLRSASRHKAAPAPAPAPARLAPLPCQKGHSDIHPCTGGKDKKHQKVFFFLDHLEKSLTTHFLHQPKRVVL